jgi:hypothetical protein
MLGADEFESTPDNLFEDLALDQWLSEGDYAQDQTPPVGTNHVAAQILDLALGLDPEFARGFAAFGVGQQGVQAERTSRVRSLTDVGFTWPGGTRVNLEVDQVGRIDTHAGDHLRAMREAARRGHSPGAARSVFVGTDPAGLIREVRHVHYESRRGGRGRSRIVPVEDAHITLPQPLTPQEAWARGLLQNVPPARPRSPVLARGAVSGRTRVRRPPVAPGARRAARFDDFDDMFSMA